MQDCAMFYMREASKYIDQMKEVSLYSALFEAEGKDVESKDEVVNAELGEKSANLLQRAIEAVKKIIDKIRKTASNILDYLKLGKSEKEAYNEFVRKCKEDKEFAGQKVTVKNWKEIDKAYDDLIAEIQREIEKVERTKEEARPQVIKAFEEKIAKMGPSVKNAVVQVALDQLVTRAKYDEEMAINVQRALEIDSRRLDGLTSELKKKEVRRSKRKLRWMTSSNRLLRYLAGVRHEKLTIHEQAMKEERDIRRAYLKSAAKVTVRYGKDLGAGKVAKIGFDVLNQTGSDIINAKKRTWKEKRYAKSYARGEKRYNKRVERYQNAVEKSRGEQQFDRADVAAERRNIRKERKDEKKAQKTENDE